MTLAPPTDLKEVSSIMNIRVADINALSHEWRSEGAEFLTPPIGRALRSDAT